MATEVTRAEFEARIGVLEREVEGEKIVTRHIVEQTRRNSDDLAALKTRVARVEEKVDGLDRRFDGLERRFDGLERKVDGLVHELPKIVGDTMREVLDERDRRGRA